MSAHGNIQSKAEYFDKKDSSPLSLILVVLAVVGLVGSGIGAFVNPNQFAYSWLFGFAYFFTLCSGSLFWILVHHTTDAEWSVVVRRQLENVATLIPYMGLFFIPVYLCASTLFKWWTMSPGDDAILAAKAGFLNIPFFTIRAVAYFVALSAVAYLAKRHSVRQDEDGNTSHTISLRKLGFIGIPLLAVSVTFGAVDWLMALDYKWFSTMWGVYIFAGAAGASMCLLVLIITFLRSKGYLADTVTMQHYHIMGKLILAFCVFWAYIGFSQYMLIWYSNIPEETFYFIRRNTETWWYFSTFLVVGRFFAPFPFLLLQATKKNVKWICIAAGWLLFMQAIDLYVIILPMLHVHGARPHILDLLPFLGIGATLGLLFLKALPKTSLLPVRDPRIKESITLTN